MGHDRHRTKARLLAIAGLALATAVAAQSPTSRLRAAGFEPTIAGARAVLRAAHPGTAGRPLRVQWWVEQLDDPVFAVRERAARQLRATGAAAAAALEQACDSEATEIRRRAGELLATIRREHEPLLAAAIDVLVAGDATGVADDIVRAAAAVSRTMQDQLARALEHVAQPDELPALLRALRDDRASIRRVAARGSVGLVPTNRVSELRFAAADPDPEVRLTIARRLIEARDRAALVTLIDLLGDAVPARVRADADAILRAATEQKFDFVAYGAPAARRAAIARWREWLRLEGADAELTLPLRLGDEELEIRGFWISVTGRGVTFLDREYQHERFIECEPYDVDASSDGSLVVASRSRGKVDRFDADGKPTGSIDGLQSPCDADRLPNGNVLVVEGGSNAVTEVTESGDRVWSVGGLSSPFDAQRLPNGNTLVADSGHDRVIEFSPAGTVVAIIDGIDFPNGVYRTSDGHTIVTTYTSGEVLMFDPHGILSWRTKVGGTVYSPCLAAGEIWVADGAGGRLIALDLQGRSLRAVGIGIRTFNDVSYAR